MNIIDDAISAFLAETDALGVKDCKLTYKGEPIASEHLKRFKDSHFELIEQTLSYAVDYARGK